MVMAAIEETAADGCLPDAKRRLADAVASLIDPQSEVMDGTLHWTDSLYIQLQESLPADQGVGHGVARSLPPVWSDALDLLTEIDTAVTAWEPRPHIDASKDEQPPLTVLRLQALNARSWRPQDVRSMDQISGNVESWTAGIKTLLKPLPRWTLPNPCPACGAKIVYRRDSAGDMVRQPALQIGPLGCTCTRCQHTWAPEYFTHLARVLGYEMPAGVLE